MSGQEPGGDLGPRIGQAAAEVKAAATAPVPLTVESLGRIRDAADVLAARLGEVRKVYAAPSFQVSLRASVEAFRAAFQTIKFSRRALSGPPPLRVNGADYQRRLRARRRRRK